MKKSTLTVLAIAVFLSISTFASPVYAYIDPATSSYVIQIVAGIVIAAGATVGIFWKKIKLFFKEQKIKRLEKKLTAEAEKKENK